MATTTIPVTGSIPSPDIAQANPRIEYQSALEFGNDNVASINVTNAGNVTMQVNIDSLIVEDENGELIDANPVWQTVTVNPNVEGVFDGDTAEMCIIQPNRMAILECRATIPAREPGQPARVLSGSLQLTDSQRL